MTILETLRRKHAHKNRSKTPSKRVHRHRHHRSLLSKHSPPLHRNNNNRHLSAQNQQQQRNPTARRFLQLRRNMSSAERSYHNRHNNDGSGETPIKPLAMDYYTTELMRAIVVNCVLDKPHSCTLYDVLRALIANEGVFALYNFLPPSHDNDNYDRRSNVNNASSSIFGGWWLQPLRNMFRSSTKEEDDTTTKHTYELMSCLERAQSHAPSTPIHSWEDFREAMVTVGFMQFDEEEPESIYGGNNSPWAMQSSAKRAMLDEKLRTLNQKLQSVSLAPTNGMIDTSSSLTLDRVVDEDNRVPRSTLDKADVAFLERLQREQEKTMQQRKPRAVLEAEERMRQEEEAAERQRLEEEERRLEQEQREREARERALSLMRPLTDEEEDRVYEALYGEGSNDAIVSKIDARQVTRESIRRLQPGEWLNDEILQFFLKCLEIRDKTVCEAQPGKARSHFVQTFFMSKLLDEGHADPAIQGMYNYNNVKRWSKQAPGKDLFQLDKIFFPINQGGQHWVCAVVYMKDKVIQFYDSLHGSGRGYLQHIFQYLQDEHRAKKRAELPDLDEWRLIPCDIYNTPRQLNGYDCGVFTCMFCDFLSKDCPITFGQEEITACRQRIALSILNRAAIL